MATLMAQLPEQVRSTPDDVLRLEEAGLYELVKGQLVEKPMTSLANQTASLIVAKLVEGSARKGLGVVFVEQTFQCFPEDPDEVRRPDVAFVSADNEARVEEDGHVTIAPDLAIEVISPSNKIDDLEQKIADYFSAGVKLVWTVNPKFRWVRVHRPGVPSIEFREADTITGEPVLPGFSAVVRDLLPPRKQP